MDFSFVFEIVVVLLLRSMPGLWGYLVRYQELEKSLSLVDQLYISEMAIEM